MGQLSNVVSNVMSDSGSGFNPPVENPIRLEPLAPLQPEQNKQSGIKPIQFSDNAATNNFINSLNPSASNSSSNSGGMADMIKSIGGLMGGDSGSVSGSLASGGAVDDSFASGGAMDALSALSDFHSKKTINIANNELDSLLYSVYNKLKIKNVRK